MGASNLLPLVVLFAVVGGVAYVGYQVSIRPRTSLYVERLLTRARTHKIFLYTNELAERGVHKLEKKNVVFTKDGAKVGVKEVSAEKYADKTQRAFVNTWNAAQDG
jgi:hypothetical protein